METVIERDWTYYWSGADYVLLYAYFGAAALFCLYLVFKAKVAYKAEIFVLAFYLMTGNLNRLLTVNLGFFEITPERFLFLTLAFLVIRQIFFTNHRRPFDTEGKLPWFMIMLIGYLLLFSCSQFANVSTLGPTKVVDNIIDTSIFLLLILSLQTIGNQKVYDIFGKVFICVGVITTCVGIIQLLGPDPYFMKAGSPRDAFGDIFRSSGIFAEEHHHSYFLLTAIIWTLIRMKNELLKLVLVSFFILGIFISFHRMSYVLLSLVLLVYFLKLRRLPITHLVLSSLLGMAGILILALLFYRSVMDTTFAQERLTDGPGGRLGYYSMVLNSIGGSPIFGYGGKKNAVYYEYMLEITRNHERAAGTTGGVHNGYLASMFYSGIPASVCFGAFALLTIFYFARLSNYDVFFAIPMLFGICFLVGNMTNSILLPRYIALLYGLQIGLGMNARYQLNLTQKGKTPRLVAT